MSHSYCTVWGLAIHWSAFSSSTVTRYIVEVLERGFNNLSLLWLHSSVFSLSTLLNHSVGEGPPSPSPQCSSFQWWGTGHLQVSSVPYGPPPFHSWWKIPVQSSKNVNISSLLVILVPGCRCHLTMTFLPSKSSTSSSSSSSLTYMSFWTSDGLGHVSKSQSSASSEGTQIHKRRKRTSEIVHDVIECNI